MATKTVQRGAICTPVVEIKHPSFNGVTGYYSTCLRPRCSWAVIKRDSAEVEWDRRQHAHEHTRRDAS